MESCCEMDPLRDFKPESFVPKEETGSKGKYRAESACDYKLPYTEKERSEFYDAEYKCNEEKENKSSVKIEPTDYKDLEGILKTELEGNLKTETSSLDEKIGGSSRSEFVIKKEPDVKEFVPTHDIKGSMFTDIKGKSFSNCFVLLQKIKKDDFKNYRVRPEEVLIVNCHNQKLKKESICSPYLSEESCDTDEETEESSPQKGSHASNIVGFEQNIDDESLKELEKLMNDHKQQKFCKLCHKRHPKKIHFMQHLNIKPFVCSHCSKCFTQKAHVQGHILLKHSTTKQHSCPICKKSFKTKNVLRSHINCVHSTAILECNECNNKFKTKTALKWHLKIHTNIRPHVCPVCDKSFVQRGNMIQHEKLHYEERPFSCTLCPMKFKIKKDLSRHMVKHTDTYNYCCSHCGKKFKYKNMYNEHVALHENPNAFTCKVCHKIYVSYHGLRSHMRSHEEEKTFLCDKCDKTFPYVEAFREHKSYVHSTKTYECQCGKKFAHRQYLRNHIKYNHSSQVTFTCGLCSNTYRSKYSLANHKKKHH